MPAVAVIPAPLLFNKIVAVKKLVVGIVGDFYVLAPSLPFGNACELAHPPFLGSRKGVGTYFEKIKALQAQFILMNITAWNNTIGLLT